MALQVWLPLTKDLRNQGLSNVTVTNNGATFNSAGKLGGCYTFDGNDYIHISMPSGMTTIKNTSVAAWVKSTSSTLALGGISHDTGNNVVGSCTLYSSGWQFSNNGSWGYVSGGTIANTNTWHHVVCTISDDTITTYLNGVRVATDTVANKCAITTLNSSNFIEIGCDHPGGDEYLTGSVNDFRIYDHCLSPMEVKKLSQGLVLHYPLNRQGFGQDNLATCTTPQYNLAAETGNYNYFWINSSTLEPNTTYTFSAEVEVSDNIKQCTIYNYTSSGNSGSLIHTFPADGKRHSWTFTTTTTGLGLIGYAGNSGATAGHSAIYRNIKVEKGDKATPYIPRSNEVLYTTMGLNGTTEYDCSGYCNNGEYYAYDTNGSISYTSDTPKYNVSTHIASANPTQNAASGTRYLYGHCELTNPTQMSVAFWLKPITGGYGGTTSNGQGYFCTTNYEYGDTNVGTDYQASAMNHRDGAVNMNDSASTTQCNVTFYPTIGEWHHYVYTYDGQVGRGYKDGVQIATAQFSAAKILDSFIGVVIGFSRAGGVWRRNDACYSDFRIYATALSADDVKSLYQNSAYIDSSGNVYGAVHTEV